MTYIPLQRENTDKSGLQKKKKKKKVLPVHVQKIQFKLHEQINRYQLWWVHYITNVIYMNIIG